MLSRFKKKQPVEPEPEPATLQSPAEESAVEQKKAEVIRATGIEVNEALNQLKKFKKTHQWV